MMLCAKLSIPLAEASRRLERLIFFTSLDCNREKVLLMAAEVCVRAVRACVCVCVGGGGGTEQNSYHDSDQHHPTRLTVTAKTVWNSTGSAELECSARHTLFFLTAGQPLCHLKTCQKMSHILTNYVSCPISALHIS
jgi:hypothetical protein